MPLLSDYRKIVSGERRGLLTCLLRGGLWGASVPYGLAVRWRNRRFDQDGSRIERVDVPVISVGNVTVGGTGKTPMVEWLAKWFRERGVRVVLVSRGYGAEAGSRNDEALELEQKLPDVPHLQNPDRVAAARTAIEEFESQLILLDDAFQHRRIHRDLDIVLIDALEPFGYGHLLPRGLLREPLVGLQRADVVVLTRADAIPEADRDTIRERVHKYAGDAAWLEVSHHPACLRSSSGTEMPLDELASQRVLAFCGIGNPRGFSHSLSTCSFDVAELREFPDHHAYAREDIERLGEWAAESDAAAVVCTHKDLVKVAVDRLGGKPLFALQVGMRVLRGSEELDCRLQAIADELLSG